MKLSIKVAPGSSRDGITGWLGETLKIRVKAPAERGRANRAIEQLLAEALGAPKSSVQIIGGETMTRKTVEIRGMSESEVYGKLPPIVQD